MDFAKYHHARVSEKHIYYTQLVKDEHVEMSLYLNEKLVARTKGVTGNFELKHEDILLKIENKTFKSSCNLTVSGDPIDFKKVKKKELVQILKDNKFYNELNLSEEAKAKRKIKATYFLLPLILLAIGTFLYFQFGNSPKILLKIAPFLVIFLSFGMIYSIFSNRFPVLDIPKTSLIFAILAGMAYTTVLDRIDYGAQGKGALYKQLNTEKSALLKVKISEVNHVGTIYYKGRPKNDPYYNHIYNFKINDKLYEGAHHNPTPQYAVGDSLEIFYLLDDPRINRSAELVYKKDSK